MQRPAEYRAHFLVTYSRLKKTVYDQSSSDEQQQETDSVKPGNYRKANHNYQRAISLPSSQFSIPDRMLERIPAMLTFPLNYQSVRFANATNNQRHVTPPE